MHQSPFLRAAAFLAIAHFVSSCATTTAGQHEDVAVDKHGTSARVAAARAAAEGTPVGNQRAAYYRRAFPKAKSFVDKPIPKEMLRSWDAGNDTYVEARAAGAAVLGYLRDFTGPVSPSDSCSCNPLRLTLVFGRDARLRTLLAPAPLEKRDHQQMSDAEMARLIAIAKDPPKDLLETLRIDDVVDETTGATKPAFSGKVIEAAALSTRRVVGLVQDTQRILLGAPLGRDKKRLDAILGAQLDSAARARALAEFLQTHESDETGEYAYRVMVHAYIESLAAAGAADKLVEERLLHPRLAGELPLVLASCYDLLQHRLGLSLVKRCDAQLRQQGALARGGALAAQAARFVGSLAFEEGDMERAASSLRRAANTIGVDYDPLMHLRLARALAATGEKTAACFSVRDVYLAQPLAPGVKQALSLCDGKANELEAELQKEAKEKLLQKSLSPPLPVPTLSLEDDTLNTVDLDLKDGGKITVLAFFATWCPHCQKEMPRLVSFARELSAANLSGRVRVIGVRTAVEKESEPYEDFKQRAGINFLVLTDATMSLTFAKFAKAVGISPGLPTIAVVDAHGALRFLLEPGDYKDTKQELLWAVRSLLD